MGIDMTKGKSREIPRAKMQDGINLCKENIFAFLETAEKLANFGNLNHAAINIEFAIEEFGKILMLKDEFAKGDDQVQVSNNVFKYHPTKSKRAWKEADADALDVSYRMISEGGFERSENGKQGFPRAFSQVIYISHYIRLECAFVDFDENEKDWFLGHPQLVKNRIQELIEHIRQKTANIVLK
jgi:AbiV family abortive infection protein